MTHFTFVVSCFHLQSGDDILAVRAEAYSDCSHLRGDVVDVGDCLGVDKTVLDDGRSTCTFFSLRKTTESLPLMATAVSPQVLTALKAYST